MWNRNRTVNATIVKIILSRRRNFINSRKISFNLSRFRRSRTSNLFSYCFKNVSLWFHRHQKKCELDLIRTICLTLFVLCVWKGVGLKSPETAELLFGINRSRNVRILQVKARVFFFSNTSDNCLSKVVDTMFCFQKRGFFAFSSQLWSSELLR